MWIRMLTVVGLTLLCTKLYKFWLLLAPFQAIYTHFPGPCRLLPGIEEGSEDIELMQDGTALFTSGLRWMTNDNPIFDTHKGRVFRFNFKDPQAAPETINILGLDPDDQDLFNPHGMSSWIDNDVTYVYVVNHKKTGSVVEKFLYAPDKATLSLASTFGTGDENFKVLNDLVMVGLDKFYFVNCHYMRSNIEMYLLLRWGSVGYFDGERSSLVLTGKLFPNGINVSPNLKHLYLAHAGDREVVTYDILSDGTLQLTQATPVYCLPDNIFVDKTNGDLFVGCSHGWYSGIQYLMDPRAKASNQVLRLATSDGLVTSMSEVLADEGSVMSSSSSAVRYGDQMLVGTVASQAMYCEVKHMP